MDAPTYPGRGLSLSQLMFALNEELRRVAYSSSFTLDEASQFNRDLLKVLAVVPEWKNSFVPINRIPSEILSLIPTHLSSNKDRFHASSVCRHWRRTFLQHGTLWSRIFFENCGHEHLTTLLKRAKGSALDVVIDRNAPLHTMTLLSPHVQQIKYLEFQSNCWTDILTFPQVGSGPLPLLHTLRMGTLRHFHPHGQPNTLTAPSLPLFSGAVNLQEFIFTSSWGQNLSVPLKYFVFPNLATLRLDVYLTTDLNISNVLDFLKASPTLRNVEAKISGSIISEGIPRKMVVVLPNVKTFSLSVSDDGQHVFDPAHISCPAAKYTSLTHQTCDWDMAPGLVLFPPPDSWKAIAYQYSTHPVEEVTLEITDGHPGTLIPYSLTFRSADSTVIRLNFGVIDTDADEDELNLLYGKMDLEIFSQACRTIRSHPLLPHLKRLHIKNEAKIFYVGYALQMAEAAGELLRSLGPLDELTIHGCDLQVFLAPFIALPEFRRFERVFPLVKQFVVSKPREHSTQHCMDAIVELVKSQHELEKPFDRVTVNMMGVPGKMAEKLRQWVVGTVDCCEP